MAVRPPILKRGDTIGIVTLGSPLVPARINEGIKTLGSLGFKTVLGKNVYTTTGFLAGTDQQRAADLMAMFSNKTVKMILPTRGGVGVAGILPYLNFSVIRQNPKIVSGYSDITILLNALYQYGNLISLQSLLLLDFNLETPAYNYDQFFLATSTFQSPRQIVNPPSIPQISRVRGNVTGEVVGGNLTSFVDNLGTPFEINTTGKILVIEETHEPMNTVYRYLNHLKIAGKFADCAGIVMGECTSCEPAYAVTYEQLIKDFMIPLGKPLMTNVTTAHGYYKSAIPIGARARLDTVNNKFTILEPSVSNA
ncbi:S66 peptidase family protein [Fictibacillus fluitans]|uniref:LD-carboxypeptidase n=1 Tax=Fictibacillus fluitans TaxID=3058422 RepID=A0ABT8HUX4_9BACL|nr:LD-carboxypeptidase [Fictibacillus sp. NE201]MDN4524575.1 LD-carboxypeptidase [Fictibacillus sp. NE201]